MCLRKKNEKRITYQRKKQREKAGGEAKQRGGKRFCCTHPRYRKTPTTNACKGIRTTKHRERDGRGETKGEEKVSHKKCGTFEVGENEEEEDGEVFVTMRIVITHTHTVSSFSFAPASTRTHTSSLASSTPASNNVGEKSEFIAGVHKTENRERGKGGETGRNGGGKEVNSSFAPMRMNVTGERRK